MTTPNRIRYGTEAVLDQVEIRNYVYNPDTTLWEASKENDLLTDVLAKLEEIRVLLSAAHPW